MLRKQKYYFKKHNCIGYLFIAPQLLGFLLFVVGPIISIIILSFQDYNLLRGGISWLGLGNYKFIFTEDRLFLQVLRNSLTFSAGLVLMNVSLALLLAVTLYRKLSGMVFFRTLFFSPVVTSTVAWVLVWSFILQSERGMINQLLRLVGVSGPRWLAEPGWAMFSVIFVRVIKNVGLNTVILLSALKDIPVEFIEAAKVDGATYFQIVRKIVLPLLSSTIMLVVIITIIGSLNVFDHIMLMTAGGPANSTLVLAYYIYYQAFLTNEIGYASALAVILFTLVLGLTILQWVLRKNWVYYEQ